MLCTALLEILRCGAKISLLFAMQDTYKELIKSLDVAKCEANKKLKIQNEAQKALVYFKKAPSVYNDRNVVIYPEAQLPRIKDKNMKYPAMSSAVAFK